MYPLDRRSLASHVYDHVKSLRKAAVILKVSHTTVRRWIRSPDRSRYMRQSHKGDLIKGLVLQAVHGAPLSTLADLQRMISSLTELHVSKQLIRTILFRHGLTRKKARFYGEPKDLLAKTTNFLTARSVARTNGRPFVSIDETSFGRHGGPAFGYAQRGAKVFVRKNGCPRVTTSTVVACVAPDGLVHRRTITGSCNTARFAEFLRECKLPGGTVVLLDNVSFHHARYVKETADAANLQLLFTPPYSPWFNPIEGCFSVVKRAYYKGCSVDAAFAALEPRHCRAFFRRSLDATDRF